MSSYRTKRSRGYTKYKIDAAFYERLKFGCTMASSNITASALFNVNGVVAIVTGSGTGTLRQLDSL
jgi:hypothetical protein